MRRDYGIVGRAAPELRVPVWFNTATDVRITDICEPVIYLFAFQSSCRGCHLHGFPTMRQVRRRLRDKGLDGKVIFLVVQTAFEGPDVNTADRALKTVAQYDLVDVAVGHDSGTLPALMEDYRTGGTPWTVIIGPGPDRVVHFDGFQVNIGRALATVKGLLRSQTCGATRA